MLVWTIPARIAADSPIMTVYRGRGCTYKTELCQAVGLLVTLLMAGSCHGVLLCQAVGLLVTLLMVRVLTWCPPWSGTAAGGARMLSHAGIDWWNKR